VFSDKRRIAPSAGPIFTKNRESTKFVLEPIQEVVESDESVVILCWRLIRGGAPDVEA